MNTIIRLLACVMLTSLVFTGCKKKVEGCTDSAAANYNPDANQNCCCKFAREVTYDLRHSEASTFEYSIGFSDYLLTDTVTDYDTMFTKTLYKFDNTSIFSWSTSDTDTVWLKISVDGEVFASDTAVGVDSYASVAGVIY